MPEWVKDQLKQLEHEEALASELASYAAKTRGWTTTDESRFEQWLLSLRGRVTRATSKARTEALAEEFLRGRRRARLGWLAAWSSILLVPLASWSVSHFSADQYLGAVLGLLGVLAFPMVVVSWLGWIASSNR